MTNKAILSRASHLKRDREIEREREREREIKREIERYIYIYIYIYIRKGSKETENSLLQ
jgi:hypothetical protein